ncbi:MAG: TraR/DksA C4-type zinc finger protein [Candidatus Susulua stagnicola]|nr:TraR/DksA C4-type zinc finger protein [Candidatus Susulua stagnicola]
MKKRFAKKDLDSYKEKLFDLKDDVLAQIRDTSKDTLMKSQKDISGYGLHLADVATDSYERDFNLNLVSNERRIVINIDEALKRIQDKSYGICGVCKKDIAKSRLNVMPYAKYCRRCKEKLEKENKL